VLTDPLTETDVLARLESFVQGYPTQKAAAHALGVSQSYLSDLRGGRRPLTDTVLGRLGVRREVRYLIAQEAP
jgi:hypothetical protein